MLSLLTSVAHTIFVITVFSVQKKGFQMSVEISSTRREVKIPPLNVDPLAGKSGSKGVAENKNADF